MAVGWVSRSLSSPSAGAWSLLALPVILPILLFLLTWAIIGLAGKDCGLALAGIGDLSCGELRVVSFVASVAGIFLAVVLIWWLRSELIGLRRIFEVPWFGVGEEIENVGVIESIVRAGLFVGAVWLTLGLCVLAFIGIFGRITTGGGTDTPPITVSQVPPVDMAPVIEAAGKLTAEVKGIRDQLTNRPEHVGADPAIVPQLQRLGEGLRDIQTVLASQDRKLDALQGIDTRLARWEQQRNDAAILAEAKRANGTLGEVRTLLDGQTRKLAALDEFERLLRDLDVTQVPAVKSEIGRVNGGVTDMLQQLRAQTAALTDIESLLKLHGSGTSKPVVPSPPVVFVDPSKPVAPPPVVVVYPPQPGPVPPPGEASCFDRGDGTTRRVSAAASPRRYDRTLLVFFDKAGSELTPGARERLRELADELRHVDQPAVSIFGSADAQGDPGRNARYAERRAQVVKQFLEPSVPDLKVQMTSSGSTDQPASEPYNRIARVEAHGTCH